MNAHRKIVVGVDGSQNAVLALKWALAEARLRGDTVEVLHGWHFPYISDPTGIVPLPTAALQESAEMVVSDALTECAAEAEGVDVTTRVEETTGAEFLIEASKDADLLVFAGDPLSPASPLKVVVLDGKIVRRADAPPTETRK